MVKDVKRNVFMLSLVLLFLLVIAACSDANQSDGDNQSPKPNATKTEELKPATLTFYLNGAETVMEDLYFPMIKRKFPQYELIGVKTGKGTTINELVVAGAIPDFYVGGHPDITGNITTLELATDIDGLLKANKYDLSRINPTFIEAMKSASGGKIIGLPHSVSSWALHYNKDLFDKFGVAYPKSGMTWDETYEIAKKMTRFENGVQYRGYTDRWHQMFMEYNQFSLPYISATENKAAVNTDAWKNIMTNTMRFYQFPGLTFNSTTSNSTVDWDLFQTGISAMTIRAKPENIKGDFEWDIVSAPTYKERPGVGIQGIPSSFFLINGSKNKEAAIHVMSYMTSDEAQLALAKAGRATILNNPSDQIKKSYLEENPYYKGKNVEAFFYNKPASVPPARAPGLVVYNNAQTEFFAQMRAVMEGTIDINTALRNTDEAINKGIAQAAVK